MALAKYVSGNRIKSAEQNANIAEAFTLIGLTTIRGIIAATVPFSAGQIDGWGDAFTSKTGRNTSVDSTTTAAYFTTSKYIAATYDLSATLSALYEFENSDYADWSGYDNTLTAQGSGNSFGAGKVGSVALVLNGSGYANNTAPTNIPTGNNPYSFALWVNVNNAPGGGVVYQLVTIGNTSGTGSITLDYRDSAGTKQLRVGTNSASMLVATTLTPGTWYHIVGIYNTSGTPLLYLNGVSQTLSGSSSVANVATARITIGALYDGTLKADVKFDNVRIYPSVLSSGNVTTIYNSGTGEAGVSSNTALVVLNIPASTFVSTVASAIGVPFIQDWETGADIQYKLTNGSEDSGYLSLANTPIISTFTAFTSQPTKLTIKLVPKVSSPTFGYPSIKGFWTRSTPQA